MKIVYISSSIIPSRAANSIHVMKMCQAFATNEYSVTLIAPNIKSKEQNGISNIYDYYGVEKNFRIKKVYWAPKRGGGYIYGWFAARVARRLKPDIVYSRNLIASYFATLLGQKTIFEAHAPINKTDKLHKWFFGFSDLPFRTMMSGKLQGWFFRKLIKRNEFIKLVVITESLKNNFIKSYPELKNRILVAPDGADEVESDLVAVHLANKASRLQVGYVGHLYSGKGMEVISKLAPLNLSIDFHVVGGTAHDLIHWQNKCMHINNLFFHGYIEPSLVQKYIKAFDVLLLPNQPNVQTYGEGRDDIGQWTSPLKAFEYMAHGKPILVSDLSVLKEVFVHKQNALLCKHDEIEMWSEALQLLYEMPSLSEHISQQAYYQFITKYTWKVRAKKLIESVSNCKNE